MLRFLALLWRRLKLAFASFYTYIKGKFPPQYPETSKDTSHRPGPTPSKHDVTAPPAPSTPGPTFSKPDAPISDSVPFDITKLYDPNGQVAKEIQRCIALQQERNAVKNPVSYFSNHLLKTLQELYEERFASAQIHDVLSVGDIEAFQEKLQCPVSLMLYEPHDELVLLETGHTVSKEYFIEVAKTANEVRDTNHHNIYERNGVISTLDNYIVGATPLYSANCPVTAQSMYNLNPEHAVRNVPVEQLLSCLKEGATVQDIKSSLFSCGSLLSSVSVGPK